MGQEIVSAGADGLVKLWNYKKNLCLNTFDKHEGKIWAMDCVDNQFITGDNNSTFHIWEDCT
jgi:U3 small nucleolar RNA-associated protein 13